MIDVMMMVMMLMLNADDGDDDDIDDDDDDRTDDHEKKTTRATTVNITITAVSTTTGEREQDTCMRVLLPNGTPRKSTSKTQACVIIVLCNLKAHTNS